MNYHLIGGATGWGAQHRECEEGPIYLREQKLVEQLRQKGFSLKDMELLLPERKAEGALVPFSETLPYIHHFNLQLSKSVESTLAANEFPIVIGGDHSIAVGTWNGVYQSLKKKNMLPFGLIWIDAHMDSHTPETSLTGAPHGMPLAGLLGCGHPSFSKLYESDPVLFPENLCLIGVRSFEEGEARLLQRLNVRVYLENEVRERGFKEVFQEAVTRVSKETRGFGVSLDLDAICPEEAPGVGSPEEGGIHAKDLLEGLALLRENPLFKALELVEYNPQRDVENRTAQLCFEILSRIMISN